VVNHDRLALLVHRGAVYRSTGVCFMSGVRTVCRYLDRINSNPNTDPNPNPNPNSDRLIGRSRLTFTIRSTCLVSTNTTSGYQPTDVHIWVAARIYIMHCIALTLTVINDLRIKGVLT